MPRDLPVGNESYLILFDRNYQISEVFYPKVGMENHSLGHRFRFGVFVDSQFSWTVNWKKDMKYLEDSLTTDVMLQNDQLALSMKCNDCVDFVSPLFLRSITVNNLANKPREVRLFFHQDFHVRGNAIGDTVYFDPVKTNAIVHYKTDRYFLANCLTEAGDGIYQYACGVKEVGSALGTWKDAEDGFLSCNPIAQGSVDSVISARLTVEAEAAASLHYWIVAGKTYDEVQRRDSFIKTRTPKKLMKRTSDFWKLWASKVTLSSSGLSQAVIGCYRRSLLVVKSQSDADGAVIAANDTDTLQFNKDTYSYMWPRDGAFVTMAMDDAGYHVFARRFFQFCQATILPQGWFFHKYQPDKSPGSSWHPWIVAGEQQLPIQEDETALVVISLWNHFQHYRDVDLVKDFYSPIVKRAGTFMSQYRDQVTHLPLESYDLWEERRMVLTFTCSAVYSGLMAAARFASAFGEEEIESRFLQSAEEVKEGIIKQLYDPALGRFLRGISVQGGTVTSKDSTIDSSLAGVFLFNVLPPDDAMVVSTMQQIEDKLKVRTSVGGFARYELDKYQAVNQNDMSIPGNPWFVTTLWIADWYIEKANKKADLAKAKELLEWAASHALPSGIMAEQLNPYDGTPLSVSPLTWSHGTFIDSVNRYVRKFAQLPS